jgi:hypothetical protein
LKERGYIRPSKRQKQNIGLATPESIRWIVDSEKIKDAIYGYGYLHKMPEFFYTVIAYWVHRKKNNIPISLGQRFGWDQLSSAMDTWAKAMKSFGYEVNWKEVEAAVESIGSQIYDEILGNSKQDENVDSISNDKIKDPNVLSFLQFAEEHGIDTTNVMEENRLKTVYLGLAKQLHPDLNKDKEFAEEDTAQLTRLWQAIPENIRNAFFNLAFFKFAKKLYKI